MSLENKNIQTTLIHFLQEGKQVEVPAFGMSMFPLLLPGDVLLVNPVKPQKGDIGVFIGQRKLIAHRVYKISNNAYHFKGDGLIYPDHPVPYEKVLGTVISRRRNNETKNCKKGWFRVFKRLMPQLTFYTGRLFFYSGRIKTKLR